jgi:hypothetical protein
MLRESLAMSTAVNQKRKPLLPPEERFWQRYSPNHEFPTAGVTSFFVHGLILGALVLGGIWYLSARDSDNRKPPSMDVVQVAGGGDGFEGAGGEPGLPGDAGSKTEVVPNSLPNIAEAISDPTLKDAPKLEFDIPEIGPMDPKTDVDSLLSDVGKEADTQAKKEAQKPASIKMPGTGNPKGVGGKGGTGGGPGRGTKGSGLGLGGPGGRKASKAEIYAWRWRFDLTGSGKEHAQKYLAMGVTVAILAPTGKYLFVGDLRRRPVDLQPGNLEKFKDAVKWQNTKPESLQALARELQLPFVPAQVIILLPRDREERMAAEELRYAEKMGRGPQQIQATWFDFRLRDGVFEPVVIMQQ